MAHEIIAARALIARATGEQVDLFRPPYEGRTPAVDREVRSLGMLQVLWNVDSTDSVGGDYATIERVVLGGLDPGSIVLMHENHGQTIRALPTILKAVAHRHLQPVTIPELITLDPPSPEQLRSGLGGCPVSRAGGNGG
jgi:peptidoglycan/xylan/chitin deacetylase (PgdA/CDA1 family)